MCEHERERERERESYSYTICMQIAPQLVVMVSTDRRESMND